MENDKIKFITIQIAFVCFLFFALFALNIVSRLTLSIVMSIFAVLVYYCMKKNNAISTNKKHIQILMIVFANLYLGIFYLLGLYFGFIRTKIPLSIMSIVNYILPISIIIISSEIIRNKFLANRVMIRIKLKKIDLSIIFTYISMVIVDILIYTDVYNLAKLDDFLVMIGFVLFASLSCNLLYNFISIRFGSKCVIYYRLITILFIYVFPIIPNVYIFFRTFLRMLYPYIIYLVLNKIYFTNNYVMGNNEKREIVIGNTLIVLIAALIVMLISNQFKFGIIVIGSSSMTGSINKADAVIFEKYNNQVIEVGDVIIFDYNNIKTVHRVSRIEKINGEYRYYTKGDANKNEDDYYRKDEDIYAIVNLKIKYVGYPTLWLRDLFY